MSQKRRVLFLCTGNSARSQMAEALVNNFLGDRWSAFSAGTQPAAAIHPLAVEVMAELGIDISDRQPKAVSHFEDDHVDLVVTLCDAAAQDCPLWLGPGKVRYMSFPDPAQASGNEEKQLDVFRQVSDTIRDRVFSRLEAIESLPTKEDLL